jgi:TRAP-type mannitol/chloroaromatic compound transport system substrate-binding protein
MTTHSFAENADNLDVISSQYPNVQIRQFPENVMQALKQSNAELILRERARSPLAEKIIASREQYLSKARAWTNIGLKAYLDTVTD